MDHELKISSSELLGERVEEWMEEQGLTDGQASKFLGIHSNKLKDAKAGKIQPHVFERLVCRGGMNPVYLWFGIGPLMIQTSEEEELKRLRESNKQLRSVVERMRDLGEATASAAKEVI